MAADRNIADNAVANVSILSMSAEDVARTLAGQATTPTVFSGPHGHGCNYLRGLQSSEKENAAPGLGERERERERERAGFLGLTMAGTAYRFRTVLVDPPRAGLGFLFFYHYNLHFSFLYFFYYHHHRKRRFIIIIINNHQ